MSLQKTKLVRHQQINDSDMLSQSLAALQRSVNMWILAAGAMSVQMCTSLDAVSATLISCIAETLGLQLLDMRIFPKLSCFLTGRATASCLRACVRRRLRW